MSKITDLKTVDSREKIFSTLDKIESKGDHKRVLRENGSDKKDKKLESS